MKNNYLTTSLTRLPLLIKIFFLIDIGLCIAYIINFSIGKPYYKLTLLLNLDGENSLASWFSTIQLFCIFIFSSIFTFYNYSHNKKSFLLILLPIIFLLMSIDEATEIHEWLGAMSDTLLPDSDRGNSPFKVTGIWMFVLGAPFTVFFIIWFNSLKFFFSEMKPSYNKILIGMVLLLTGALGVEIISNFVRGRLLTLQIVLEESLEMMGATIILWGVYELAVYYFSKNWNMKNV